MIEGKNIPLQAYVRSRQLQLAESIQDRKAVYLDTKFWIILREVVMGVRTGTEEQELLSLLREAVHRRLIFCPISDSTFAELLKIGDLKSRRAMADLIDALSLGITLIPYDMRAGTELAHFIHASLTPNEVLPLDDLVWTKLTYVLGFMFPQRTPFSPEKEQSMQRAFFEHMWTVSLREMIDRIGEHPLPETGRFEKLAEDLNRLNATYSGELRTFEGTYENEVHGVLNVFANVAVDVIEQMRILEVGKERVLSSSEREEQGKQLHNLLFAAFKKNSTKQTLRTLHIIAILHAAVRWNRQQRLKANDFMDFQHATAALGYCDAFFTERSLRSLVTAHHIALDQTYGCYVGFRPQDAIAYLQELLNAPRAAMTA